MTFYQDITVGGEVVTESSDDEEVEPPVMEMERLEKRRNTVDSVTRKYSTAVSHNPFKMKMKLKKGTLLINSGHCK